MSFAHPWFCLLLIPLALLLFFAWRRPLPSLRVSALNPFRRAGGGRTAPALLWPFLLTSVALALLVIAAARPRYSDETVTVRTKGIDIILALDLSGSMEIIDLPAHITTERELLNGLKTGTIKNRLDSAMEAIIEFIGKRPDDRIGLIGFAGLPYTVCPPTLDHAFLTANISRLKPGLIGSNTGLAGPIASAVQRLKDSDAKRRVLVFFTDGCNNVEARISPMQAAIIARDFDIVIYTVGIGSERGVVVRQSAFGGNEVISVRDEFDEPLLRDMARETGGQYYHVADAEGAAHAMREIDRLEKITIEQPAYIEYSEYGPRLCLVAAGLLLLAFLLENTIFLRVP